MHRFVLQILDSKKFSLERALEVDQRFLESASSSDDEATAHDQSQARSAGAEQAQQPREDAGGGAGPSSARPSKRGASEMEQAAEVWDPVLLQIEQLQGSC